MPNMAIYPITRSLARELCEKHPHARTLPNSSKYYFVAYIGGKLAGLAVWGWGIMPRHTPGHLFGDASTIKDYLELSRYFVYDWTPKNSATQFLSGTHRIIKKYAPWVKYLYTYAAGFQGMVGTIYQAANYDYIGKVLCDSFFYFPDVGLVHMIPLWHRYGAIGERMEFLKGLHPGVKKWCGYNFRYIYWLCGRREKKELLNNAKFTIQPYPTMDDVEVWLKDVDGTKEQLTTKFAKTIPIVKLKSKRGQSVQGDTLTVQVGEPGSSPGVRSVI